MHREIHIFPQVQLLHFCSQTHGCTRQMAYALLQVQQLELVLDQGWTGADPVP